MSRIAKDPALSALAVELKTTKFSDAPDLEEVIRERFVELARGHGEYPFRLVYQMPDFKTWVVRLYLGGAVRTIGFSARLTDACRYADMAALRFWKYRVRGASEPVDANLNFDVAQAKYDSTEEIEAAYLLDRIENYLLSSGALGDPKQSEIDRQRNRKARDARRTVRHDLHALIDGLNEKLDLIDARLKHIEDGVCKKQINPEWVRSEWDVCFEPRGRDFKHEPNPAWRDPLPGEVTGAVFSPAGEIRLVPFNVWVIPDHYITLHVPARIVNGLEILTPEAHEMIWKYRVRGASEPVDANLNFDVAQAKYDSTEEIDRARKDERAMEGEIRGVQSGPVPEEVKVVAQDVITTLENLFSSSPIDNSPKS